MNGKRIFVSGGAGVIGQEVIPRLLKRGATVFVGDLKPRPPSLPKSVRYRQGDLNTLSQSELDSFNPEIIIHLAATFERSIETYDFWDENFLHNIKLSHHLMTISKDLSSLKRVVFASSYLIYDPKVYLFDKPQDHSVGLKESDPILPRNLTGMAKYAHEAELQFLQKFRSSQLSTVCARIFRGYGCNSRDVISRWIRLILNEEPITIYRPEGRFDYIYAADSAEGLVRLAEEETISGIINLGTGKSRSVQDIVNILKRHFPNMESSEIESDISFESSHADMTRFSNSINWLPEYSLEAGISEIIEYEKRNHNMKMSLFPQLGNVLVSSASKKTSLIQSVKEAAQKVNPNIRIIAGDIDVNVLSRYMADEFWIMPYTVDAEVPRIIEGCLERNVSVIIPTRDGELDFWARNRDKFSSDGIQLIVSPKDSVKICHDKLAFADFGKIHGLPIVTAGLSPEKMGGGAFVVKERYGAGSQKIGLNLSKEEAFTHAKHLRNPIFQPFIDGKEISIDAWVNQKHQVKGIILRNRDIVVDGESQVSTTFQDRNLEALAQKIFESLRLQGPVVLQMIIDKNGNPNVIECNPRFGGASTTAIAAGLDIWYWTLLEAAGSNIEEYPFNRLKGEVRQIRVPHDIFEFDPDI